MIWALLAAYFLGGGLGGVNGSLLTTAVVKQMSERTETIIDDPSRAAAVQQTLRELRKEIRAFERMFAKSGKQLTKSYKNHAAGQEQAFAILSDLNSNWEAMQISAIDLRFELRAQMTEAEWDELFVQE
ncbi:MAG: hypothetical protein V3R56_04350 [Xanthomonadales bacterium]